MADEQSWLLDQLAELVSLESPSGDAARLGVLRDVLAAKLTAAGASVSIEPGPSGDHLVAAVDGTAAEHVLVLGHYDTVWPVGRLGQQPFAVDGDVARGPGVFDMKAGLVALLWALRNLDENPPYPLRIVLTTDEEVGSPSGGRVVLAGCEGAVAAYALEPPLPKGTLKVGRRGVARSRLAVTGREAHAGLDARSGVSAVDELVDQLVALRAAVPPSPARSVNVGRISGGSRANVIAGAAEAELGLRFATAADEVAVEKALHGLTPIRAGVAITVEPLSRRPAWEPSTSHALAQHVIAMAAELGEHVTTGVSGGAGDANLTGAAGVPTVDGLGPRGHGAHAPDETVEIPSILQRARLLRELLRNPVP